MKRGEKSPNVFCEDEQPLTDAVSLCWAGVEPLVTLTAVTAHRVLTASILTDAWLSAALVQV